jgi:ribosomal protein L22
MSEKPHDEQTPEQDEGAAAGKESEEVKPKAAKKPAAEKTAAAKKPASAGKTTEEGSKESAKKDASAQKKPASTPKTSAEAPKTAKKPVAKSADEDAPVAEKKPAARKPATAKADKQDAKPATTAEDASEKPASKAAASAKTPASVQRRRVVRAQARYVRTSARKARMVCGHLRGKSVVEARAILAFTPREVARDWSKLLESALANAENNHELFEDELFVREAYADEGPTIKRFRPRAMGRATPIRKRTSHLTITLTPKP